MTEQMNNTTYIDDILSIHCRNKHNFSHHTLRATYNILLTVPATVCRPYRFMSDAFRLPLHFANRIFKRGK